MDDATIEPTSELFTSLFSTEAAPATPSTILDDWLYPTTIESTDFFPSSPTNRFHDDFTLTSSAEALFGSLDQDDSRASTISPEQLMTPYETSPVHLPEGSSIDMDCKQGRYRKAAGSQLLVDKSGHAFVSPRKIKSAVIASETKHARKGRKRKLDDPIADAQPLAKRRRTVPVRSETSKATTTRKKQPWQQAPVSLAVSLSPSPENSHDSGWQWNKENQDQSNTEQRLRFRVQKLEEEIKQKDGQIQVLQGRMRSILCFVQAMVYQQ